MKQSATEIINLNKVILSGVERLNKTEQLTQKMLFYKSDKKTEIKSLTLTKSNSIRINEKI